MSLFGMRAHFDHKFAKKNLSAYLDNALSEREQRRIRRHLQGCAACRHDLATLQATRRVLRELPLKPLPRSFTLPVSAQRQQRSFRHWNMAYSAMRGLAVAISFVLVLLLSGDALMSMGVISVIEKIQPESAPIALESAPTPESRAIVAKEAEQTLTNAPGRTPAGKGETAVSERQTVEPAAISAAGAASPVAKALAPMPPSPSAKGLTAKRAAVPALTPTKAYVSGTPVGQAQGIQQEAAQASEKAEAPKGMAKPTTQEGSATQATRERREQPAGSVTPSPLWKLWGEIRLLSGLLLGILFMLLAGLVWASQKRRI